MSYYWSLSITPSFDTFCQDFSKKSEKNCFRTAYLCTMAIQYLLHVDYTRTLSTQAGFLSPVHVVSLFFYHSFFITRFLYLFLKVTAFFKVMGSNPGWGNFFIFFYFSIIFSIKNCVENIKGTFYSNFINTWFQVITV